MRSKAFAIVLLVVLGSSAAAPAATIGATARRRRAAAKPERFGEDSLWGKRSLLADEKFRTHDLITIVIRESSKTSTSLETEYEKDGEFQIAMGKALSIKETDGGGVTYAPAVKKPEIDISHGRKHEGKGEIEQDTSFEARITAEVIEVLPNGDLVLEARKRVTISEERTELILTGRVRPEHVKNYTVESDRVADVHIQYRPKGAVADANKRGWLHRLFDFINVF
ncbi:MAG: flagellar basal body L-ring protein FlgH [Planctomycetota bacterium]|jgi:flagellar L-ring protein precursor FlgH